MLYKLYGFLKDRQPLDHSQLQKRYLRTLLLKEHMLLELWARSGVADHAAIQQAKEDLGSEPFRKFLMSPLVSSKLLHAEMNPELYLQLLQAENLKCAKRIHPGPVIWTALGDQCFGGDKASPSLANEHLPLDFFSPWVDEGDQLGTMCYDPAEALDISKKISESMALIREVDESLYHFTRASTEVIQIRKTAKIYSYSAERRLGRIFFGQPIVHYRTEVGLACGIYHEAIHNHIYLIERFQHMFTQREGMQHYVVSPWSGNTIELHSFCHAIFVWYSLWAFCKLCGHRVPRVAEEARASGVEAGFGFLRGVAILDTLHAQQKSKLDLSFLLAVEEMQADVRADEQRHFKRDGSCVLSQFLQHG